MVYLEKNMDTCALLVSKMTVKFFIYVTAKKHLWKNVFAEVLETIFVWLSVLVFSSDAPGMLNSLLQVLDYSKVACIFVQMSYV